MSSSVPAVNFYIQFTPDQVTPPQVAPIVLTGNSSSGSTSLTVASGLTVWTNSVIVGPGIAAGTVVSGYSGTTITLSQALTANVTTGNEFVIVGAQTAKTWTITGASGSGSVITFTYSGTPTISAGQTVTISGITPSQYNGTYTVLTSTSSQFTVSSSATGSYSSGGTVAAGWSAFADWIEEVNIRSGRQHYLDRIESTTLEVTLDNRTGAFSSLGSTVVPRLPILFTATYNNYTYALFNGIVESIDTHIQDQLNANLSIRATDNLKFLALKYVNNTAFYATYVPQSNFVTNTTGAISWYRMNANTSFGGTLIDSLPYNATTAPGSGYNGRVIGSAFLDQPGVLLYETTTCADLTGGTGNGTGSTPQGSLYIPASFGGTTADAIDFWLIGEGTTNQVITTNLTPLIGFTAYTSKLWVNDLGQVQWDLTTGGTTTKAFNPTPVNDGLWHHIALSMDGYNLVIYVDGVSVVAISGGGTYQGGTVAGVPFYLGGQTPTLSAYIDELVVSNVGSEGNARAILDGQIKSRYIAGVLLRRAQNSADRVAEILVAAGFGNIAISNASYPASVAVNPTNLYIDSPWFGVTANAFSPGGSNNGTVWVQGMTSAVTKSTAQDLILGISDTECGNFHQSPAGMFMFRTRDYPYTVTNAITPQAILSDDPTSGRTNYDASSFDFSRDDVDTWTTVIVTPQNGTDQVYNTGLGYLYGDSTLTKSNTQNNDLVSTKATANYLGYIFQSPLPRVTAVDIHSENYKTGGTAAAIYQSLNRGIEDRVTLYYSPTGVTSPVWAPAANPTTNHSDFLVEAIHHSFVADPGRWTTTFTLDPYPLRFDQQDGKTVGVFGSGNTFSNSAVNYTITGASGSGSVITYNYTGSPTITPGQTLTISGITTNVSPSHFNGVFTVVSATSTQFTVASGATETYSSGGTAYYGAAGVFL